MKYYGLFLILAWCCFACTDASGPGGGSSKNPAKGFYFNPIPTVPNESEQNLCRRHYNTGVAINPDPVHSNRRSFVISDGNHRVAVSYGNIIAAFILNKMGDRLEVSTSDNYPECLSNKSNFSIASDGNSFKYDNQKHIYFEVFYELQGASANIVVELSSEANYGMSVRK